ncbi:hypothetical protein OR16_29759 [Cupriavidus basilensis OR16]|uniref:Uncharacterized protein n=1 Tax=Cupriavidus basilensis OR16 TaxID=1127483 RepID=H1SCJ9_9BURK|nr:hypothetical protein [Cupriavidus basilensis]EHP39824.1 hypothetical protein OR16_29759 [Cupriavidus basilensis OR16]
MDNHLRHTPLRLALAGSIAIAALSLPSGPALAADELVIRTMGPVSYVCGGIGADEQQQLAAQQKNFNMGVLFIQGERGEFLSDVAVKMTREGHEVASFIASGPKCLIKAPQGSYNIEATYKGQAKSVSVSTGTYNAQLRW